MNYTIKSIYSPEDIINSGNMKSGIWKKTEPVMLSSHDGTAAPSNYNTSVRSLWTDKNLYICYEGEFEKIRTTNPNVPVDSLGKTHELWDLSDVYEVFIGPQSRTTKKYRELQVGPDSRWIDLTLDASGAERLADFNWTSGMVAKSNVDIVNKIWTAVFQIPFTAFSHTPKEHEIWNCNFYRISGEADNKVYLAWSPVITIRFHQPDKYGDIIFIK